MATLTVSAAEEKRAKGLGFLSNRGTDNFSARIITVNGKVTVEQLRQVAEAAEKYAAGDITITSRQTFEVQGVPFDKIEDFRACLSEGGMETGGTGSKVRPVVSCKGSTCQYGLIDTFDLSEKIHKTFYKGWAGVKLPHKFKIAVGGCPNSCVKPTLNDLGVVGQLIPAYDEDACNGCKKCTVEAACPIKAAVFDKDEGVLKIDTDKCNNCGRCLNTCAFDTITEGRQGWQIYIGGMWGKRTNSGQPLTKICESEEEVLKIIEEVILLYREQGITGERFADTIKRIGFDKVNEELLSDGILARKQEILEANLHEVGGATC